MNIFDKTFLLIILLFIPAPQISGQECIKKALTMIDAMQVPHVAAKGVHYKKWVGICNPKGIIPDKLYNNIQGTDYWSASEDPDLAPALFAKFLIPNTNLTLAAVNFGGATDSQTDVLIVVDSNGNIKSTLEVGFSWGWITPKQFRITNDYHVVISNLVPTGSASIPFNSFAQFEARRVDETYSINSSGQFVKDKREEFPSKIYTRKQLDTKSFNVWDCEKYDTQ